MTAHNHREIVPGCFRCELGQNEAREAARKQLIEDARSAFNAEWGRAHDEGDLGNRSRRGIEAALAVFEASLTPAYAPSDDEREALTKVLGVAAIQSEDRKPGQTRTEWYASAVLAAGFRRTAQAEPREGYCSHCGGFTGTAEEVVAWLQEPVEPSDAQGDSKDLRVAESTVQCEPEWEYSIAYPRGGEWDPDGVEPFDSEQDALDELAKGDYLSSDRVVRRRKPGPWLPVEDNKPETMTACCLVSRPCEKHQDARHQEVPDSTDGSER